MQPERGPGYFKINNSILLDTKYQTQIKQEILNTVQNNKDANPNTLWEVIKRNIRNTTIRYTSFKQKETHKLETKTIKTIETLEKQLHVTNSTDTTAIENAITSNKQVLEGIYHIQLNGIILRAREQHVEHNEKNTNTSQTSKNVEVNKKLYTN
ncbi:hypothetical protein DPMN_016413 [Dreissena polymorpha]|uniref:Uncharacterized protein n=1 Tax=Dreissena polymorpha TaxID=45954 RepID=A0A9D4ND38_DREPO|nr:hypothetical protein DPMN_016413 [Dreissena polymorpha]